MKHTFIFIILLISNAITYSQGKLIFRESFDYPDGPIPETWWTEGCIAEIRNGHLFINADTSSYRVSTVWLNREFSGDLNIEFDVFVISSADNANNMNCFLFYSHPSGKSLYETRDERRNADYNLYQKLDGYIFTHLANGNDTLGRFRFRDNPGFYLLEETFGYECKKGKKYHVEITKTGNHFKYFVDGKKMIDKVDDENNPVHSKGLFGFRTWHTALWWDELLIRQLDYGP